MLTKVRVLIAEPYTIFRLGLRSILAHEQDLLLVGETGSGVETVRQAARLQPDVVLIDVRLPDTDGLETVRAIRQECPACQVIVLTECGDSHCIRSAIQAGAIGYLLKDVLPADLVRAVRAAARGEPTLHPVVQRLLMQQTVTPAPQLTLLTQRETDVLQLVSQGKRNKEIAATLYLTEGTVKGYISTILEKLAVQDRTQAALYAVKHGLVATH